MPAHLFLYSGGGGRPIYLTTYHMFPPVSVTYFRIYDVVTFYIYIAFFPVAELALLDIASVTMSCWLICAFRTGATVISGTFQRCTCYSTAGM